MLWQATKNYWQKFSLEQNYFTPLYTKQDLDQGVK